MSVKIPAEFMEERSARYGDLLRLREWQVFAHRVREANNFACALCRLGHKELNVHHHAYEPGRKPWEYEVSEVTLLCRPCHQAMHDGLQNFRRYVFARMTPRGMQVLNGAMAVGLERFDAGTLARAVACLVSSPGAVRRFAEDWRDEGGEVDKQSETG